MRTRFTYVALLLAIAAGTTLTVVSCAPDSTAPRVVTGAPDPLITHQKVEDLREKYGWIGKYHTDGLEYIYSQLVRNRKRLTSKAEVCKVAAKAVKEFHRTARHGDVPAGLVDPSLSAEVCAASQDLSPISRSLFANVTPGSVRADLSATAVGYMNQIAYLSENATSRTGLLNDIYSVESQSAAVLPEAEAGAVTAVASIAVSSMYYWEANLSSWTSVSGGTQIAYSRAAESGSPARSSSVGALPDKVSATNWWSNPYIRGFGKVLGADALAGGRTIYTTWALGPISWDAAAASAVWGSTVTALALIF